MMSVVVCTVRDSACGRVLADYKPAYYWWDCLEMLRKAILTGILVIRVFLSLCHLLFVFTILCIYVLSLRGSFLTQCNILILCIADVLQERLADPASRGNGHLAR